MSFFQKVRATFGLGTGVENPIDNLDSVLLEETIAINELNEARATFNEIQEEFDLKNKACDVLIEKGHKEGTFNKIRIEDKLVRVTADYINNVNVIKSIIDEIQKRKFVIEQEVIEKAVEFVAILEQSQQAHLGDLMAEWQDTGCIDEVQIDSHALAITKAINNISDGFFEKAVAAPIGDVRTWSGGKKWQKTSNGWVPVKGAKKEVEKKHSTQEIIAHAENTSSGQLKKIASDKTKDAHVRDAAKREIERRNEPKETEKRQWAREDSVRAEDKADAAKEKKSDQKQEAKVRAEKEVADQKAADAAKAAQPQKKKKKPLLVKYTESENLSPDHKKIEKSFGKYLNNRFKNAKQRYEDKFGNVLNTDNARELSDDYENNRSELSAAVHEPSSAFIKKLYADKLAEDLPEGKRNAVLFTAGGTGAGKTTGIQGTMKGDLDRAHIVYDTNMNTFDSSVKKIEQGLEAGKNIKIAYTFRDPVDAFENGAVPRSLRIGRTVPLEEHVKTHLGSMDTIIRLAEKYKDNKKVQISVIDNSRGSGNAKLEGIDFVRKKNKMYNATELREQLHKINKTLYAEGKLPESHFKGFKGND